MTEKVTRIYGINFHQDSGVIIEGDLHVKGDLKDEFDALESLEVTGHLWVDGAVDLENCDITAKSITFLGGCSAKGIYSTEGDICITGEKITIDTVTSARHIVLKALADKEENIRYVEILDSLEAQGDITVNNCKCSCMDAQKDIMILSSLCAEEYISCIKARNIYGKKVVINELYAEDGIYLQERPEANSLDVNLPIMVAKEIVIEEN